MKKLFYLTFALLVLSFTVVSCSKDDEVATPDSLTGTEWVGTIKITAAVEFNVQATLKFTSDTEFTITSAIVPAVPGIEGSEVSGTYTYVKPAVTFLDKNDESYTGTVSGNKLTTTLLDTSIVFTRK
jgi:hypothetical protein